LRLQGFDHVDVARDLLVDAPEAHGVEDEKHEGEKER
jgi:hypothetical protein